MDSFSIGDSSHEEAICSEYSDDAMSSWWPSLTSII